LPGQITSQSNRICPGKVIEPLRKVPIARIWSAPTSHDLGPPAGAALAVSEVDVPEAFDPRGAHAPHLFMSSG
jgi:hypothetical protein